MENRTIKKALISVADKAHLADLAKELHAQGVEIYSTGGTARAIGQLGIACIPVDSLTEFPELMEGRVKTLHPKVFGGLLARRSEKKDLEEATQHNIPLFDLVVVNLYPFWDHLQSDRKTQAANIDIGGPAMLRASAKNHEALTVLSSPEDYEGFLAEFRRLGGAVSSAFRFEQAAKTFHRTAAYDAMISSCWKSEENSLPHSLALSPQKSLRYGENPHQSACWTGTAQWQILQGKELSYNNLLDAEAARSIPEEFEKPCVAIIKHGNPCGVATGTNLADVFEKALACDPQSAFGGIVATNRGIDESTAVRLAEIFLEVIIAPEFSSKALSVLSQKKNLRLINSKIERTPFNVRPALGGWLVQDNDLHGKPTDLKYVTQTKPTAEQRADLEFCWLVAKHVRSNAIVLAKDQTTVGIGAGQMSRVDAVELALKKATDHSSEGLVLASDAFFPFRDNIDRLRGKGVTAIIQPGGSKRDGEVIQACDELGIAMVFTGMRHFKH